MQIEIAVVKAPGLAFRRINYPLRKHYILLVGRTEARIIAEPTECSPARALIALVLASLMYHAS